MRERGLEGRREKLGSSGTERGRGRGMKEGRRGGGVWRRKSRRTRVQ